MMIGAMVILLVVVVVVAALGIGYVTGWIRIGKTSAVAQMGQDDSNVSPPGRTEDRIAETKILESPTGPSAISIPANDETSIKPSEPPLDPAQTVRFKAELQAAHEALGKRHFGEARQRIEKTERMAVSEEQTELVGASRALVTHVEQFWEAVHEGLKGLETAGELKVSGTMVSVVEVGPNHILIREAGENRRFSVDQLPAQITVAIAESWFDDGPENKLALGAFHFVDPPTDVAQAKRLWEEAAAAGVDVKGLLALLRLSPQ